MTSLIFPLTALALLVLFIRILIKLFRREPVRPALIAMILIIVGYSSIWVMFKMSQKLVPVDLGSQVCFDDWCATVVKAERQVTGDSVVIILHLQMFNNVRGIAQTPSEPRVHILDSSGRPWPYSIKEQLIYEKRNGSQPGIAHRLELHQSMETVLVFAIPKNTNNLKALIEEGPWITNLLFPDDEEVFLL